MKEKKLPGSRVHKIVLICVSVFSLVLLILTLMERAGLRLTAATRRHRRAVRQARFRGYSVGYRSEPRPDQRTPVACGY